MTDEEEEVIIIVEEEEDYDDSSSDGPVFVASPPPQEPQVLKPLSKDQIAEIEKKRLRVEHEIPVDAASNRILDDFYRISQSIKNDPANFFFSVNLYQNNIRFWEVRINKFDKKDPIYHDMEKYKKNSGKDYIELRVSFPPDYPLNPPFIRVVAPRCIGRTGRVTLGGSLCTSVLTVSEEGGWRPTYDFESLFVSILAEMFESEPKLRLDFDNTTPYSTTEALEAFARSAATHQWKAAKMNWKPM